MFGKVFKKMQVNYVHICKQVQQKFNEESLKLLPNFPGVYIFYFHQKPFYVGRSNCLKNRLLRQHLSKKDDVSSSSFRVHLKQLGYVKDYKEVRDWALNNCAFKFIKIDNYDDSILFEGLLIKLWRKKYKLLNDNKYEL